MSFPEVRIRPMSASDLERVVEIAASLPAAPQWAAPVYRAALDPSHAPRRIALVAADPASDAALGFLVASVVAPEAELETIAVARQGQRRGVGARLLRSLVDALRPEHVNQLLLEVRASNRAAVAFYRALGFRDAGRRARYYADPEEDAALMALRLP
jgi:[ribosomal protein S18]-alanine N-acetyltransferase